MITALGVLLLAPSARPIGMSARGLRVGFLRRAEPAFLRPAASPPFSPSVSKAARRGLPVLR